MKGWCRRQLSARSFSHLATNTFVSLTFLVFVLPSIEFRTAQLEVRGPAGAKETDALLLQSALTALKGRRGAVLVLDPQTGRIRAMVNSRMIFEESQPPGSTIKPFTTLAALESGKIGRASCRERV